ncbi:MAG TPA: hydrogen peroxide-dependent heme synthase [Longimicrobium sp.]|nr:hydrogen peroxide-dependent heme synthase [Longimicrobium sp.]
MPGQIAPATLEGWYALHQVFLTDWAALRSLSPGARADVGNSARALFQDLARGKDGGWSAHFRLAGGGADWMFIHFRPTLDELADVQLRLRDTALGEVLRLRYDYLSVTEAGLYHATAHAAGEHSPGSPAFREAIAQAAEAELASPHVRTRLYPEVPDGMRYVTFYPMSKRRGEHANWYALEVADRSRLMREHGMTGRQYAGRVFQVITGSIGLDDWEWGVTLFARDPLEFKRIVTEMRFDEASAWYGEFGSFYTGIRFAPDEWPGLLGARGNGA